MTLDQVERELRDVGERADLARGKLFRRIRDEKLYHEAGLRSFKAYCESERCEFSTRHVYRLIRLVNVADASSEPPPSMRAANPTIRPRSSDSRVTVSGDLDEHDDNGVDGEHDDEPPYVPRARDRADPLSDLRRAFSGVGAVHAHIDWGTFGRLELLDLPDLEQQAEIACDQMGQVLAALRDERELRTEITDEIDHDLAQLMGGQS